LKHPSQYGALTTDLRAQLQSAVGATYTLERELGGGGMSRVFLATELALDRPVVLKLLPPELASAVSTDRFRQEIRLAARLQHPHIVPLLSAGEADGLLYYTMPFVEGESLRVGLTRQGEFAVREAVGILRDVAAALEYAHEQGLVHRDIKPDNVLLARGEALVTDFGVAKALSAAATDRASGLTSLGVALGTPAYMAPEQAAADPRVDHRADLYAWGCLAYELLTGQSPFGGRPVSAMLAAHIAEVPEPIERRRPTVPPILAALVMRCLEKRPADRPQNASEVLQTLDSVVTTPSGGLAPTLPLKATRPVLRRSRAAGAVVAAVLLLGTGYAVLGRPSQLDPRRIAVTPFINKSSDPTIDPVSATATTRVSAGLGEIGGVEVVESAAGAGVTVSGTVYRLGEMLEVSAVVSNGGSGRIIYAVGPVGAPVAEVSQAIEAVQQRIVGGIAMLLDPSWGVQGVLPARPPRWDAYGEFHEGDLAFYREGSDSAFVHFARAAALDSTFTLARLRAAQVMVNVAARRWALADSALSAVKTARAAMSRFESGYLALLLAWFRGDWEAAHAASVELAMVAPRSEFVGYLRGTFANISRRWREAVTVFEELDPKSGDLGIRSGAYYAHLTNALHMLGDHTKALAAARTARARFPEQLRARELEVRALAAMGSDAELDARLSECLAMRLQGERTAGHVLLTAAREAGAHGYPATATRVVTRLLDWLATRSQAEARSESIRRLRAEALQLAGRWAEARAVGDSLAAEFPDNPTYVGMQGVLAARRGDRSGVEAASARLAGVRHPELRGEPTLWRARMAALTAENDRAVSLLRDALAEGSRALAQNDADPDLADLRQQPSFIELAKPRD